MELFFTFNPRIYHHVMELFRLNRYSRKSVTFVDIESFKNVELPPIILALKS
jgi:hypothetical protein